MSTISNFAGIVSRSVSPDSTASSLSSLETVAVDVAEAALRTPAASRAAIAEVAKDIKIIYRTPEAANPLASRPIATISYAELMAATATPQKVVIFDGISLLKTTADKVDSYVRSLTCGTIEYIYEEELGERFQTELGAALAAESPEAVASALQKHLS